MSEEKQITIAEFNGRLLEDNRSMKLEIRTSYELKVQKKAIAWEKEYLSRKNF